jgi:TetR/AcrR family transcriptional repressor of mexJK operon
VRRSRAAIVDAGRVLFLRQGYAGTTMDDIAAAAGLTKRTVYNNYPDKGALFTEVVRDVIGYAEAFARRLQDEFAADLPAARLAAMLDGLGQRLALGILRPDVIALRRLLIGEGRAFPSLAAHYFAHAPGQVMDALAAGFAGLDARQLLRVPDARLAAAQFAYLLVGEALDRAVLTGTLPPKARIVAAARDGVTTFVARYAAPARRRGGRR